MKKNNKIILIFNLFLFLIIQSSILLKTAKNVAGYILKEQKINLISGLAVNFFLRNEKKLNLEKLNLEKIGFKNLKNFNLVNPLSIFGGTIALRYLFKIKGLVTTDSLILAGILAGGSSSLFIDKTPYLKEIIDRSKSNYWNEEEKIREYFDKNIKDIQFILNNNDKQKKYIGRLIKDIIDATEKEENNNNNEQNNKLKEFIKTLKKNKLYKDLVEKKEQQEKEQQEKEQQEQQETAEKKEKRISGIYSYLFFIEFSDLKTINEIINKIINEDDKNLHISNLIKLYEEFIKFFNENISINSPYKNIDIIDIKENTNSISAINIFLQMQIKKLNRLKEFKIDELKSIKKNKSVIFNYDALKLLGISTVFLIGSNLILNFLKAGYKNKK